MIIQRIELRDYNQNKQFVNHYDKESAQYLTNTKFLKKYNFNIDDKIDYLINTFEEIGFQDPSLRKQKNYVLRTEDIYPYDLIYP